MDALDAYVKSRTIVNPYFVSRNMIGSGDMFGTEMNYEYDENHKDVHTWDHFAVKIPQRFVVRPDDVATKMAQWRDSANVYKRSLEELTMDAVDTVLELIAQNSLYRGKEFENAVKVFKTNKIEYDNTPTENKAAYVWLAPAWSDMGQLRIRKKGSAGGHNGIKHIIQQLGTQTFVRIKVGVGAKPKGWDLADHVLGRFSGEDRARVEEAIRDAEDAAVLMIQGEADKAMNDFNAKKQENTK